MPRCSMVSIRNRLDAATALSARLLLCRRRLFACRKPLGTADAGQLCQATGLCEEAKPGEIFSSLGRGNHCSVPPLQYQRQGFALTVPHRLDMNIMFSVLRSIIQESLGNPIDKALVCGSADQPSGSHAFTRIKRDEAISFGRRTRFSKIYFAPVSVRQAAFSLFRGAMPLSLD